ncbi:VQ motif-containing protein 8, chloroplastic-like [Mercurialis annua]|uniref:VQ motif-containing protein 8, chloroplastic-like n=1 Tax=Mercurialis annua TaxID=3986 RepID=UPI0021603105|nr:VQ motif-containing protein 8, chloroplastic-like [Mercurialis annua]
MMTSSTRKQLQGSRPAPLMVNKNYSAKIKRSLSRKGRRSPVIIYLKSPDIIHVRPEEFMGLVQRLTGRKQDHSSTHLSTSTSTACETMVDYVNGDERLESKISRQELDSSIVLNIYTQEDWTIRHSPDKGECEVNQPEYVLRSEAD